MKSERGQAAVVVGLLLIFVVGAIFMVLVGLPGMKQGADAIGDSVAEGVEAMLAVSPDPNIELDIQNVTSFWVNSQRNIRPNTHSIERHGADAWATTDCYNRNGAFAVYRVSSTEFHLLCKDNDGSIRDLILRRWSNNSKEFEVKNAFTPTPNNWTSIKAWLDGKRAELLMRGFKEIIIYVDGLIP